MSTYTFYLIIINYTLLLLLFIKYKIDKLNHNFTHEPIF